MQPFKIIFIYNLRQFDYRVIRKHRCEITDKQSEGGKRSHNAICPYFSLQNFQ